MEVPLPVRIALASAEELAWMLERIDLAEDEHTAWLDWQAQMLAHWADVAVREASGYPALTAGLADFATTVPHPPAQHPQLSPPHHR